MKIHNINNYISYNGSSKPLKHDETIKSKNYDVIEINKNKVAQDKSSINIEKIKKDLTSQINGETNNKKLEGIKESIKNNSYKIDIEELAKKLLDK